MGADAARDCASAMAMAHSWFVSRVFQRAQYVRLLTEAFLDAWLRCVFERLKDGDGQQIEFVRNRLFAVLKNGMFEVETEAATETLAEEPDIEKYLDCALDLMHWRVTPGQGPLPSFAVVRESVLSNDERQRQKNEKRRRKEQSKRKRKEKERANGKVSALDSPEHKHISIVEMVDLKAQQSGIEFYPEFGKEYDGKKVYRFGKLSIHIYDDNIFAKRDAKWKPVDIDD